MTEAQFLVILGTVWVAPHLHKWYGQTIGCIILIVAACKGLGWV
jgi:hypothetical protein